MLVQRCVQKKLCDNFDEYFKVQSHDRVTRNNNCSLRIPKIKLKYAKNGFFYIGVSLYNELPIDIRKIKDFNGFRKNVFNLYV